MGITPNLLDREMDKFVESPTRSGYTAVEVVGTFSIGDTTSIIPQITNFLATLADTEYSIALPANCKSFKLKARQICRMRVAYASGGTASSWFTIPLGGVFEDSNFYSSQSVYFQVDRANTDIELITYK